MKTKCRRSIINEVRKVCRKVLYSLQITGVIIILVPLMGKFFDMTYWDSVGSLKDIFGENFTEMMLRNILILLSVTMVLVFSHSIIERKRYKKLEDGINQLAKGAYDTRLSYGKYSSLEYKDLIDQFNQMAQELSSTETLQKNFMNDVSHEFKTPIVSIKGFAQVLKKKYKEDDEAREYLDIIIQESKRLTQLSENVLLLCKLEEQVLLRECESYHLSDQLGQSVLLLQKKWESKNLEIEFDAEDVRFTGNKLLLQQVWINLIDNAIKFSDKNSIINVQLKDLQEEVQVTIRDYGVGIDEKEQKEIFKRFYRVQTEHEDKGNGIGLSIVKRVVELHQGKINVQSKIGEGTSFQIVLPKVVQKG